MLKILNAIAAQIYKKEDSKTWSFHIGEDWDTSSEEVITFTKEVASKFQKNRNKSYGKIIPENGSADFSVQLCEFLNEENPISFGKFVENYISKTLVHQASKKKSNEGAVIVFVHYQEQMKEIAVERLLILMITNTKALKFNDSETLTLTAQEVIDLDKFVQGARVELEDFKQRHIFNNKSDDINEISFIRGTGDIRLYFTDSLGGFDLLSDKSSSANATQAVRDFLSLKLPKERGLAKEVEEKLGRFYESNNKDRKVSVEDIERVINRVLSESYPNLENEFTSFIDENDYKINDFFVQSKDISELVWIDIRTNSIKLQISKNQIGSKDSDKDITFDKDLNNLTIKQNITDESLIRQLKALID